MVALVRHRRAVLARGIAEADRRRDCVLAAPELVGDDQPARLRRRERLDRVALEVRDRLRNRKLDRGRLEVLRRREAEARRFHDCELGPAELVRDDDSPRPERLSRRDPVADEVRALVDDRAPRLARRIAECLDAGDDRLPPLLELVEQDDAAPVEHVRALRRVAEVVGDAEGEGRALRSLPGRSREGCGREGCERSQNTKRDRPSLPQGRIPSRRCLRMHEVLLL